MKKVFLLVAIVLSSFTAIAQVNNQNQTGVLNSAQKLLNTDSKFVIGGYGEVHFNKELDSDIRNNADLDVHRMVMLFGYNFSDRTQFVTELEFEHVKEVYVEQAFLQHKLNNSINFRAGLMLVPMGIINEYHEPTTFNGVERPLIDSKIAPTTWREIGVGLTGTILPASIRYQAYIMNGFNGYSKKDGLKFNGAKGLRSGRQKGAESYMSSPNFAAKVEYFGIRGLNLGLSGYFGKSQSEAYDGVEKDSPEEEFADETTVGISMIGLDARYNTGALQLRGQYYYTSLSNTEDYNSAIDGELNDLGSAMMGYYLETGYNLSKHFNNCNTDIIPFVRYEKYNTHQKVDSNITKNDAYNVKAITTGLTVRLAQNAVLKTDMQFRKSEADNSYTKTINAGIGVMF